MFQHHLIQSRVIAIGDKLLRFLLVEGSRFLNQAQKRAPAIVKMGRPMFYLRGAERVDIEAYILTALAIAVSLERANLIESDAQIRAAKWFVLVELESVLVVQVQ